MVIGRGKVGALRGLGIGVVGGGKAFCCRLSEIFEANMGIT